VRLSLFVAGRERLGGVGGSGTSIGMLRASRFCIATVAPLAGLGALWRNWACVRRIDIEELDPEVSKGV
jgi:hypothetical protein